MRKRDQVPEEFGVVSIVARLFLASLKTELAKK
jgi:hypothetical protein